MPSTPPTSTFPQVLPVRERARIVNATLQKRFDTVLPAVMTETGIDMWLIICHEDNYDPIFKTITPWQVWAPILQMVVFYQPEAGAPVERINISRTNMLGLMTDAWNANHDDDQWGCLRRVIAERNPQRIGINESPIIWAADGLTVSLKQKLVETLGADLTARLVSAEPLAIRWLETRLPAELELYQHAAKMAHALIKECFSRQVVTPGITIIEDLRAGTGGSAPPTWGCPFHFRPSFCASAAMKTRRAGAPMIRSSARAICCTAMWASSICGCSPIRRRWPMCCALVKRSSRQVCLPAWQWATGCGYFSLEVGSRGKRSNQILPAALVRPRRRHPQPASVHSLSHFLHEQVHSCWVAVGSRKNAQRGDAGHALRHRLHGRTKCDHMPNGAGRKCALCWSRMPPTEGRCGLYGWAADSVHLI
ncbi:MAG: hypothetical protein R2911_42380 [Caldilineaceae bacterium]